MGKVKKPPQETSAKGDVPDKPKKSSKGCCPTSESPQRRQPAPQSQEDFQIQLNQMALHILREAYEKIEELNIQTEEEFIKSKNGYIQKLQAKVDEEYNAKEKRVLIDTEIMHSTAINTSRMRIIMCKQNDIDAITKLLEEQIRKDMINCQYHSKILNLLILEGLYKLMESPISIRCKKQDVNLIQNILKTSQDKYKENTGQDMVLSIDTSKYLPESMIGGVVLSANNDRIVIKNTLDFRLTEVIHNCIPAINAGLFGVNPNRKFNN